MIKVKETRIPARGVCSIVWQDDVLVDWVGGGRSFGLDGKDEHGQVFYAYGFDAAVASPSSEFSVIYTRLGTKGLVLHRGKFLREINRSYYFADSYEFPIALIRLRGGQEVIVHCPDHYNQLEIEDIATGERLTSSTNREARDCFHSRLAGSPDGAFLVSAGWLWHPIDHVQLYDLSVALADPSHLDGNGLGVDAWSEEGISAAFLSDGRLAVDLVGIETDGETPNVPTEAVRLFDPSHLDTPQVIRRQERLGTMMPVGTQHLLGLYEFPKLIDLQTGEIVERWRHIKSGTQKSSILLNSDPIPPTAFDILRQRCAIADEEGVTVLEFL